MRTSFSVFDGSAADHAHAAFPSPQARDPRVVFVSSRSLEAIKVSVGAAKGEKRLKERVTDLEERVRTSL